MLQELIHHIPIKETIGPLGVKIQGITHDSRQVKPGYLFVAIPGTQQDGQEFVSDALKKGASAIVSTKKLELPAKIPQLIVDKPREVLALIAAEFYGHPSRQMTVIGVTGTNGKTTLTYLLESILNEAGRKPAVFGTINYRFAGKIYPAANTTPESCELQRLFAEVLQQGATDVVMEVSSHALMMERVAGIHFDVGIFTNLSQDHLDFHKDMDDYFDAKRRLFDHYLPQSEKKDKYAVLNMEDPRSEMIFEKASIRCLRAGLTGPYEIVCRSYRLSEEGITAQVEAGLDSLEIRSSLIGQFNLENILLVIGASLDLGIPANAVQRGIEKVTGVPGRLERIENDRGFHIFVDYAHTPDALAHVGENLRKLARGRLITIFGCGGDRDRAKRPMMGREAALRSDWIIVTSDNPRSEDPEKIVEEILPGIEELGFPSSRLLSILDRKAAIQKGLEIARRGDVLLIAGKGHEDYQILGQKKIHFSDQEVLRELLKNKKNENDGE